MEYENQNSPLHWKSKLEGLESLPGEALPDRNASWEKLYRRIETKNHSGRALWYRLAAAVLVLALLVPLFFTHTNTRPVTRPHANSGNTPPVYAAAPKDSVNPVKVPQRVSSGNAVAATSRTVIARRKRSPATVPSALHAYDTGTVSPAVVENGRLSDSSPDAANAIAAVPHIAKKLQVVHVNELGDPAWPPAEMAHNGGTHSFQIELGRQEIYSNPPLSFNNHLIQIKITPSN
jgi:hypothetical protein